MVGIVDYGMGNLLSVANAISLLGGDPRLCRQPEELADVERIVLPGVGAFRDCIGNLRQSGFAEALEQEVRQKGKPLLGICLGLQVLGRSSAEGGDHRGLGWFAGDVVKLTPSDPTLRVPHVGWNATERLLPHPCFQRLPRATDFYYVHSYAMKCDNPGDVACTFDYGGVFTAAIAKDNILATQFHPEKSQDHGLALLEGFLGWAP